MKILAIETSAKKASAAVLCDDKIVSANNIDNKKTHSESLLPIIDKTLKEAKLDISDIDAIAVAGGPGSFTGLRIGGTTAKALAMAIDKPVISVPTLGAMCYLDDYDGLYICPIIDARRNQVYAGLYKKQDNILETLISQEAVDIDELCNELATYNDRKIVILGDGVSAFRDTIIEALADNVIFEEIDKALQDAKGVALYGKLLFEQGKMIYADDFVPEYLRQSQAEREYIEIKQIDFDDDDTIENISQLEDSCFENPWPLLGLQDSIGVPTNSCFAAYHKGILCGYILISDAAGEGEIIKLAVHNSYRRRGIGEGLIRYIHALPEIDVWNLEVRSDNEPAINLYKKMNYMPMRVIKNYYHNPDCDAIAMQCVIRQSRGE